MMHQKREKQNLNIESADKNIEVLFKKVKLVMIQD